MYRVLVGNQVTIECDTPAEALALARAQAPPPRLPIPPRSFSRDGRWATRPRFLPIRCVELLQSRSGPASVDVLLNQLRSEGRTLSRATLVGVLAEGVRQGRFYRPAPSTYGIKSEIEVSP